MGLLSKAGLGFLKKKSATARPTPGGSRIVPAYDVERDDIPRYPPFIKGFPRVEVMEIIEMQGALIEKIREAMGMTNDQFNELLLPVIQNVAGLTHLLPASESHHHKGAGGLFRHSLEACLYSARASLGPIFAVDGSPQFRRNTEPLWRLACAIAGLTHDVGKPITDMVVTNKSGTKTWMPQLDHNLHDWLVGNDIGRYFLRWNNDRHKQHETVVHIVFSSLVPKAIVEKLVTQDPRIFQQLCDAVLNQSRISNKVAEMMSIGDRTSVAQDMQINRMDTDLFAYGIPIERYVFDAIRRLVSSGVWTVNEPGAKVWHLEQGTFVVWAGLSDMYNMLDKDDIPGIPRDPATLADVLIDRGFCQPQVVRVGEADELRRRYWEVQPECMPGKIEMLQFNSHAYVFTSEPPAQMPAVVTEFRPTTPGATLDDDAGERGGQADVIDEQSPVDEQSTDAPQAAAAQEQTGQGAGSAPGKAAKVAPPPAQEITGKPKQSAKLDLDTVGVSSALAMLGADIEGAKDAAGEPEKQKPEQVAEKVQKSSDPQVAPQNYAHGHNSAAAQAQASGKPAGENAPKVSAATIPEIMPKGITANPAKQAPAATAQPKPEARPQAPSKPEKPEAPDIATILGQYPESQKYLQSLIGDKSSLLGKVRSSLAISFPAGVRELGKQEDVVAAFQAEQVLDVDPVMPGIGVRVEQGLRCFVLNAQLSEAIAGELEQKGVQLPSLSAINNDKPKGKSKAKAKASAQGKAVTSEQSKKKPPTEKPAKPAASPPAAKTAKSEQPGADTVKSTTKGQQATQPAKAKQNVMPPTPAKANPPPAAEPKAEPKATTAPSKSVEEITASVRDSAVEKPGTKSPRETEEQRLERILKRQESSPSYSDITFMLQDMFVAGKGRWIPGPVVKTERYIEASSKCLDLIIDDFPSRSSGGLQSYLRRHGFIVGGATIRLSLPYKGRRTIKQSKGA